MRVMSAVFGTAFVLVAGSSALAQDPASMKAAPHAYHLTYTLTEMNGTKRVGVQHYTMSITDDNENADFRIDSKVPVEVGSGTDSKTVDLEVGLNLRARLRQFSDGLEISSYVQPTDFVDSSASPLHRPVIRDTNLMNTAILVPGKPVTLGSLDEPGSTEHLDVEVSIEPIR